MGEASGEELGVLISQLMRGEGDMEECAASVGKVKDGERLGGGVGTKAGDKVADVRRGARDV